MTNVIGPDVSFYQNDPKTPQNIDFIKMRASAEYVIIRAGQNSWVDSGFKLNWRDAKLAGLSRGSYWLYDSRTSPKRQAELWVEQFEGDFGELPLFADFEENYKGLYSGWKNWYDFLERLKQLVTKKEIAIYTAYYYWLDHAPSPDTQASNLEYFHQYPLWIANYDANEPLVPKPWTKNEWLFWQYTENGDGKLFGVESNSIDLNHFNGGLAAFQNRFKLDDTQLPEDDNLTGRTYRVTASPSIKIRKEAGATHNSIGLLYLNETVEEINANTDRSWLKICKSDGNLIGWCSSAYLEHLGGSVPPIEKKMYRVTASPSLKIRTGPGLTFTSISSLLLNEMVEVIGVNTDGTWLKVRKTDGGLVGWSYAAYLLYTGVTLPPPVGKKLYRVTATFIHVREDAALTAKLIGLIYIGEIAEELDANIDGGWLNIRKADGDLKGWSLNKYLQRIDT